jgi:hypothetical protein
MSEIKKARAVFISPGHPEAQGLWVAADPERHGVLNLLPVDPEMTPLALSWVGAIGLRDILRDWVRSGGSLPESDKLGWDGEGFVLLEAEP